MLYLIFALCAIYEDILNPIQFFKRKKQGLPPEERKDTEFKWNEFNYNGSLTEFVYVVGLIVGVLSSCREWPIFLFILIMAQIPKKAGWWIVTDAVVSIILILLILIVHFWPFISAVIYTFQLINYFAGLLV